MKLLPLLVTLTNLLDLWSSLTNPSHLGGFMNGTVIVGIGAKLHYSENFDAFKMKTLTLFLPAQICKCTTGQPTVVVKLFKIMVIVNTIVKKCSFSSKCAAEHG